MISITKNLVSIVVSDKCILRYISFLSPMELTFPFFTFSLQGLAFGIEEAFKEGKCIEGKNRHSGRINATYYRV